MKCAKDIMRPVGVTISVDRPLREALECLDDRDCHELIVVDDDEVVGFLNDGLISEFGPDPGLVEDEMVGNVMEARVGNCRPEDTADDILSQFLRYRLCIVAVVDSRHRLRGWIAPEDLRYVWAPTI